MKISKFPPTDQKSLTQTSPIPICSSDSIGILILNPEVMSDLPFIIYANGYEEEPECLQPFPPRSPLLRLEIQLKFGFPCGVNKRRMVFPRVGLEYSLRVLLNHIDENEFQVHMNRINGFRKLPKIQQNQRIFDIHCQYFSDINQTIGQVLEISAVKGTLMVDKSVDEKLASTKIHQPECKYTIHSNSVNGPVAEKVRLGDRVFHRWRCDDKYALKVYQCYATDGRNREHQIINDQGCSTDTSLMPHPQYIDNPSQALASSRVFRFNSSSRIFFDCLLYACLKIDPECRRTTQKCISRTSSRNTYKFQRQKREITSNSEMISSERYSMAPQIDKLTVRLDTVEAKEENNDKSTEYKLRSALEYSQKAVKALTLLNLVSLLTAVLLGFALCCLKRRSNNKILISSLSG
uniref:ZP domain-containing protein n=1 Tax=Meloidogyne enterolobii TaxID=390850 RepID=A0A6V7WTC0_MELEN|nr:unnamed protein product [Meloidogyne enterolobii]